MSHSIPTTVRSVASEHVSWTDWEACIEARGVTIDRPVGSTHPEYPSVVYPLDYGFIPGTVGTDNEPVDVFVGSGVLGLVGLILTADHRRDEREAKLLYGCTPPEIYTAHGFINFDRRLLEGVLVLRTSMDELWRDHRSVNASAK